MTLREHHPEPRNPLGIDGIEFIEYATSQPQALGTVLQTLGFLPVARHRSREVMLYRQGTMNLIVNAHPDALPGMAAPATTPELKAIALRVRDAGYAWRHAQELGAWEMPTRASAMELNIPGIHGVGDTLIYFVDRYRDFSIYDVDFVPLPSADRHPPAVAGLHWFGVVQTIGPDRTAEWVDFYHNLFDFSVLPEGQYFGILPKGTLLESPCHKFYLQLLEPPPGSEDIEWSEGLLRVGLGAPDVRAATRALQDRGVVFVDRGPVQPSEKGALTQVYLGGVTFELVVSHLQP
jgi:4-hydroxyphenylpyruvate dioxygenase